MITTKYNERGLLTNNPNEHRGWLDNNKEGVDIRGSDESARKKHGSARVHPKSDEIVRSQTETIRPGRKCPKSDTTYPK